MVPVGGLLFKSLRVYQIWGANTDVGKTVFSTILSISACDRRRNPREHVHFLKPVSTGPKDEADDHHLRLYFRKRMNGKPVWPWFTCSALVQYDEPVSPHIAAARSNEGLISDPDLVSAVHKHVTDLALGDMPVGGWVFCETAGGVHSPGPSGTSQADLYRPLRIPAILIGDSKLGGISATISAFESLRLRGYDVDSVLLFKNETYQNNRYLTDYFHKFGIPCIAIGAPPERQIDDDKNRAILYHYYEAKARSNVIKNTLKDLVLRHNQRFRALASMHKEAHDTIWYPFTQQKLLSPERITAIDSANGDFFQTFLPATPDKDTGKLNYKQRVAGRISPSHLRPSFDGSASWWTQGLGHGNPQLTLAAAYAAGRYGHVMFAEAIHQPALQLARLLLKGLDNPRLSRVFYSDNGSTGIEVAVKMALRAARLRYGWGAREELGILGLKGSYHGDTIGAMDCSEPGIYNEKIEWYRGKGYWFEFPVVKMANGHWIVELPEHLGERFGSRKTHKFQHLDDIFHLRLRDGAKLARSYEAYIKDTIKGLQDQGLKFGALLLEPVVLGAGGMQLVDPLFQKVLVNVVRSNPDLFATSAPIPVSTDDRDWTGLPVVFDEVFTGLYRLGRPKSASFLGVDPDISVHAKLMTGGLLPLAATVASEAIFHAFQSEDKSDALLHGHSYTAHAVGCQVALESLGTMRRMASDGAWDTFKKDWETRRSKPSLIETDGVWSVWSHGFVRKLSMRIGRVEGVWALGSVLAIHFEDATGSGYKSNASRALQAELMAGGVDLANSNVHSRVLGNVLYLMASQTTTVATIRDLEQRILRAEARLSEVIPVSEI